MPPWTRGGQLRGLTPTQEEGSGGWAHLDGLGEVFKVSEGEWSLNPQTHGHTVRGLMLPDARNPYPLTDPIHLPSPRRVETLVVLPNPPTGSFPVPTLMTLVSTTVVQMYGHLMIQAFDVIAGGNSIGCRQWARMSPGFSPTLLTSRPIIVKARQLQSLYHGTGSLFFQKLELAYLERWILYSPHLRGKPQTVVSRVWPSVPFLGCGKPGKVEKTWKWLWVTSIPDTSHLNEF